MNILLGEKKCIKHFFLFLQQLLSFSKLKLKIMVTTMLVDGALVLVQKRSVVMNINGKKCLKLITRIVDIHTGIPLDIKETIKEIK
jgi:hypothetical protein